MAEKATPTYWYGADAESARGRRMLEALRLYQAAETAMRQRTRRAMSMGQNDVLVLRFVIRTHRAGGTVTPTDIARYLGISTASTTVLIDRLERSGHLARSAHPHDRRRIIITHTAQADDQVRATLGEMHQRMMAATHGVTDAEAEIVISFLERMRRVVENADPPAPHQGSSRAGVARPHPGRNTNAY